MKKITQKFIWNTLFILNSVIIFSQEKDKFQYHRCSTVEYEAELKAQYPNRMTTMEFEKFLSPHIQKFKADKKAGNYRKLTYTIPVVIHIIHNGDAIGTGENITDAQAISQITVMNQDYRRLAATPGGRNSTGLAVDTEINFVLAKQDPNGNPTTGIVRHNITPYSNNIENNDQGADWETRADTEMMKTNTIWDPTRYLNIWTIRPGGLPLNQGGQSGLLGYAQFPSNSGLSGMQTNGGLASTDGVVASFDAFGTNALNDGSFTLNPTYNLGRTMTHEIGHWLGLRHIWGDDGCSSVDLTNNYTNEDFCADTPAAAAANYSCTANTDSCTNIPGVDMIQNYMDYTPDSCMDTFTNDQKNRIQTVMQVADRRGVLNNSLVSNITKAGIYFTQEKFTSIVNKVANCGYTDVNYKVSILKAPTANTIVTFRPITQGSNAVLGKDFDIITPTVTFNTGSSLPQQMVVRFYNGGVIDNDKIIKIGMTVNNNGGDALIIDSYAGSDSPSILTCTLKNTQNAPSDSMTNIAFLENNDGSTLPIIINTDLDRDNRKWEIFNSSTTSRSIGFSERWLGSRSWTQINYTDIPLTPDNLITFNTPIVLPNNGILKYKVASIDNTDFEENYSVYITTSKDPNTIINQQPIITESLTKGKTIFNKNIDLSAYAGQTVYLSIRHYNCTNKNILMMDDFEINSSSPVDANFVQQVVNSNTKYQATINRAGNTYAVDTLTNKLMLLMSNNSSFNYGCTNVFINRDQTTAGSTAVNYGSNVDNNKKVMAKSFTISPTTNNPAGTETIKFYFTEAEISAWETITGNSRNTLKIIKEGLNTPISTTLGSFGNNTTLSGNVPNGLNGVYYFGTNETLNTKQEEFESFTMYPNPTKDAFTIQLTSSEPKIDVKINDLYGRDIYTLKFNNEGVFNETIELASLQSGVYLVNITDGNKKSVRRIIKN
ncbi:peptidase [Flavobacterium columnare]|uniref:T9SS-dependent choice-of-anchor J family protein n=1 Tax=Flavobacterium columnare TaxID=996 RepID=UPI000D1C0873|nr:T9SS type A sorting domain-containing protein [Flavobacterium columnare]MBF6652496.1 peptidase [Flavobacterium columnare]MBF6655510.1 peptidase [Flavobacterium columnare]MBF6658365.1 peptidase [Flavobacterium columnare]PTD14805.1 peptidase [Flavobacterium columnare]